MHVVWKAYFDSESEAGAGNTGAIRLFQRKFEVWHLNGFRNLLAEFGKKFGDQAVTRKPLAVFCFEELFLNNAVSINEKIAGTRKPFCIPVASSFNTPYSRITLESGSASKGYSMWWRSAKNLKISWLS